MSREEFVRRWQFVVTGMAAHGYHAEANLTPLERTKYQLDVAKHVHETLGQMYDSLAGARPAEPPKLSTKTPTPMPARPLNGNGTPKGAA